MVEIDRQLGKVVLTDRERDILRLLTNGLTDNEIADAVILTVGTVKWYNRQIYSKLGVRNRAEAITQAQRLGLLTAVPQPAAQLSIHHLPRQATTFIGRTTELAQIAQLLSDPACQLLTLVGPGGIGKTRLAIEAAAQQLGNYRDGVYFVAMQPINSPDHIIPTIASAINFQFYPGADPKQQLLDFLRHKQQLLILDNFEHLLGGVDIISDILAEAPNLRAMVTSREALNLQEEWLYPVKGMGFPISLNDGPIDDYSAVQLFVQSARRVRVDFNLADDPASVLRICQMLEGIPLGLELAASWVRVLPCVTIAAEIEHGIDILESRVRNVPARHRNMRAVLDYSWNLLSEDEQDIFAKLSVFRGGCSRQAAEAVTNASLGILSALVDKTRLRVSPAGRFEMQPLLRQYAEERLKAAPETSQEMHVRHCTYYSTSVARWEADLTGHGQLEALNEIQADFENILAAWDWALQQHDGETVNRSLQGMYLFFEARSRFQEGRDLFEQAQKVFSSPVDEPLWGRLLARATRLQVQGNFELDERIQSRIECSLAIAQKYNNLSEVGFCFWTLGELARIERNVHEASAHFEKALAHYTRLNVRYYVGRTIQYLAFCPFLLGQMEKFVSLTQQSLNMAREIGDKIGIAEGLFSLAIAAAPFGNLDQFEAYAAEALILRRETGDRAHLTINLALLGFYAFFRGDVETARTRATEALNLALDINFSEGKSMALETLGLVANLNEDYPRARLLCEESRAIATNGMQLICLEFQSAMNACGLGDYRSARLHNQAVLHQVAPFHQPQYTHYGLAISAIILAHEGFSQYAVELLSLTYAHYPRGIGWLEKWRLSADLRAALEAELGPEGFAAAWARGAQLDPETVLAQLIEVFQTSPESQPDTVESPGNLALTEPLNQRELEVLQLIVSGLSNRQIAERLILSEGTVKWYTTQLYSKLGVQNRAQAVYRAQQLALFR
jgi:predicted ATPase/DNA-binding NarL/FixJ family response regulator